jgi:hypothetical protein
MLGVIVGRAVMVGRDVGNIVGVEVGRAVVGTLGAVVVGAATGRRVPGGNEGGAGTSGEGSVVVVEAGARSEGGLVVVVAGDGTVGCVVAGCWPRTTTGSSAENKISAISTRHFMNTILPLLLQKPLENSLAWFLIEQGAGKEWLQLHGDMTAAAAGGVRITIASFVDITTSDAMTHLGRWWWAFRKIVVVFVVVVP